jgi:hypothetical protein
VRHTDKLASDLARRSLVQRGRPGGGDMAAQVKLYDLLHNFATGMANKQFGSSAALQSVLLDAYRAKCPDGWPSGPNDGYFLQSLCSHLIAADQTGDAATMLSGLPWVEAKSRAGLVFDLQEDYRDVAALPEAQAGLQLPRGKSWNGTGSDALSACSRTVRNCWHTSIIDLFNCLGSPDFNPNPA